MLFKKKIAFFGRHSHRTPLSYPDFQHLYSDYFEFTRSAERADYLVTGFLIDVRENAEFLAKILRQNSYVKLVVLSEEPLWDTLWSGDYHDRVARVETDSGIFNLHVLDHFTTEIYNFKKIPYFITTSNDYFVRYANLFKRNSGLTSKEILDVWKDAPIRQAFYAEKRKTENYEVADVKDDVYGLSVFRTKLAELAEGQGVVRVGQGWSEIKRQSLPDWHLDKIASLNRHAYMVSGIENTHHPLYITEKIFDAFAVLGVPLYVASDRHSVKSLIPGNSFINLYDRTPTQAVDTINKFYPDAEFVGRYREAQKTLADLFSDPSIYWDERKGIVNKVIGELKKVAKAAQ